MTKKFEAYVGKSYRIVIPRDFARKLGIQVGDKLELEVKRIIRLGTIEVREVGV